MFRWSISGALLLMKQRTEITFETEETVLLRQSPAAVTEYCPFCMAVTNMVTPEAAAVLWKVSERAIFRLLESGNIHFLERGRIFICINSMLRDEGERL